AGWRRAMVAKAARTESGSLTSHCTAMARSPISVAAASTLARVRPSSTTLSPSWAKRRARARPSPTPAPVITMVFDIPGFSTGWFEWLAAELRVYGEVAGVGHAAGPEAVAARLL